MKYRYIVFWGIFIAYFIFVHPCIIYYNTPHSSNNTPNGILALFFLASSFILWGIVLGFTLRPILKNGILAKRNFTYINQSGRRVQGFIQESKLLKTHQSGWVSREIIFEIINFSGQKIRHKMTINDTRPQESRFETGKVIYLKVDPDFKRNPYFFLEGSQSKVNPLLLVIWFAFFSGVVAYYYYAYTTENGGLGWRFLELFHPLLLIPTCFIVFVGLIYFFIKVFVMGNKTIKEQLQLKFWGEKATAHIIEVKQTGNYLNNQPQVKYTLEFKDKKGKLIQVAKKEFVSLTDIGHVSSLKEKGIFYLPDNPEKFNFFDEINN